MSNKAIPVTSVLLATDEVSELPNYARQIFESDEWFGDEPAPVTRNLASELSNHGFQVGFTKLDELADSLSTRAKLGIIYHAICILTVRVWRIGNTLRSAVETVRNLPDDFTFNNGLRLKTLPVSIANPMNLLDNAKKYDSNLAWISTAPWIGIQQTNETVPETLIRCISDWQAELVVELEYVGCGISMDEAGNLEVFPFFRKKSTESLFFGSQATIQRLRGTGFLRLPKEVVAIADSINALERALNEVQTLPRKAQEPCLQRCLEEHPILITQGLFKTPWSRRTLRNPDPLKQAVQPDFVMTPRVDWEGILRPKILEIKTPEKIAIHQKRLTKDLLDALEKLMGRYARFYQDQSTRQEQIRVYGCPIERPTYALLIDRRLSPENKLAWEEARSKSDWKNVSLVTYDDLFDLAAQRLNLVQQVQFRLNKKLGFSE